MPVPLYKLMLLVVLAQCYGQQNVIAKNGRLAGFKLGQRIRQVVKNRRTTEICYDVVGCFDLHPKSPLHRIPENPHVLNTRFYLFRNNIQFSQPDILYSGDNGTSLHNSKFNYNQPVKVIIHGFMGRWNSEGALNASYAYLRIYNCNVILMDWSTAARGPQYVNAASNTEVVGRQLGLLLNEMILVGLNPRNIHLIGFSLGAHVAACASEFLKSKNYLIGRITGLDASSPLFRNSHIREKSKKLDKEDAVFVDVLHTDASPVFVDGFGLWEPIGHVDFFANGGQEQPGCIDRHPSVVVTHFEKTLSRDTACSHIRAFELFLETILSKSDKSNTCEFLAYKCPGGFPTFENGMCFPQLEKSGDPLAIDLKYRDDIGTLGENARGNGIMYFLTTSNSPYCGTPLQAHVRLSQKTQPTLGILIMNLNIGNSKTAFQFHCELIDPVVKNMNIYSLSTMAYNMLSPNLATVGVVLKYLHIEVSRDNSTKSLGNTVSIEDIKIKDVYGNSWKYGGNEFVVSENEINHMVSLAKTNL